MHPYQSGRWYSGDKVWITLGRIHPQIAQERNWPAATYCMQVDIDDRLSVYPEIQKISAYPTIRRDIALWVPNTVPYRTVEKIIQKKGSLKLSDIKRKIVKVDYESKVPILFDRLLREREHISLAVDKKGDIMGLVTLEDIIETVFGLEIVDESDTVVDLQVLAKQKGNKIKK